MQMIILTGNATRGGAFVHIRSVPPCLTGTHPNTAAPCSDHFDTWLLLWYN